VAANIDFYFSMSCERRASAPKSKPKTTAAKKRKLEQADSDSDGELVKNGKAAQPAKIGKVR